MADLPGYISDTELYYDEIAGGGSGCSCASPIFEDHFAGGNTGLAFQNPDGYYERVPFGVDPVDAAHPAVISSEAVQVIVGGGPSGENAADFYQASGYDPNDYQVAGIAYGGFGPLFPSEPESTIQKQGAWPAQYGCVSVDYRMTTDSLDASGMSYAPMIVLNTRAFLNSWSILLALNNWEDGVFRFELEAEGWTDYYELASPFYSTAELVALGWTNFKIEWQCGTVVGDFDDVLADGFVRVTMGSTVLFYLTEVDLVFFDSMYPSGTGNVLNGVWLGYYGLVGRAANLVVCGSSSGPEPPSQEPRVDSSRPACGDADGTGAGPFADPNVPLPPWIARCAGGGEGPDGTDPSNSEDWSLGL